MILNVLTVTRFSCPQSLGHYEYPKVKTNYKVTVETKSYKVTSRIAFVLFSPFVSFLSILVSSLSPHSPLTLTWTSSDLSEHSFNSQVVQQDSEEKTVDLSHQFW